ncbi:bicaudal D-related protein homolog isoform X2 [Pecten maximus]|uniref:bicaudal D-related protein homolog isoform X2 n=1 Tax=Pecten maximus TaxID=6579 RepID=UPI0014590B07|nr:bicaudal D-related protein homolog isoform X2 [Pecten maximus]
MCACRLECGGSSPSSPHGQFDIDDYYSLAQTMGDREDEDNPTTPTEDDVYTQLAQKERDLTLAAELGKALLEKNAELERRNELLIEEYSKKLEELEQEKYELHLKLEKTEAEYENKIKELQYDIDQIRHDLQSQMYQSSSDDKEKANIIKDITLQNERLKEDVQRAIFRENELSSEVQGLREQVMSRKSSMHIHLSQLEILQEEISILNQRKADLERRIAVLSEEKEAMKGRHEDSVEKIMTLEKQNREKEQQIQHQQRDLIELQETNLQLEAQLHTLASQNLSRGHVLQSELAGQGNGHSQSLFSEMSGMTNQSNGQSNDSGHSTSLFEELSGASKHIPVANMMLDGDDSCSLRPMSLSQMMEEDDFECDDEDTGFSYHGSDTSPLSSTMLSDSAFLSHFQNSSCVMDVDSETHTQLQAILKLQDELVQSYRQLRQMCSDFSPMIPRSQSSILEEDGLQPGKLSGVLLNLRELMQDMVPRKVMFSAASQANLAEDEDDISLSELQKHIGELKFELSEAQGDLDRVKTELNERDQQLETKSQELGQLTNKVSILELTRQHDEITRAQTHRDQVQNMSGCVMSRDEVIEQARRDRDEAVEKQNKMEIELARAKLDLLSLNSQLMETIQQKVALSQQLDQWQGREEQVDMEDLLGSQMKKRIQEQSEKEIIVDKLTKQIKMRKSKSSSFV